MVPHGKQPGLRRTSLRGLVEFDPRRDDFFRFVVEQRERVSKTDKPLAAFLKTLATAGSYGLFVEVNPKPNRDGRRLTIWSGETRYQCPSTILEQPGRWYFPPIASLITAGGRLLLAILERNVTVRDGSFLFCDIDSLCIVAAESRQWIPIPGGPVARGGVDGIMAQSRDDVRDIVARFGPINPYDRSLVSEILKIESVNVDEHGDPRDLRGLAISAKRYVLYERTNESLTIVEPKAHGLGYLYPPVDRGEGRPWHADAWDWLLRAILDLPATRPTWFARPAMMRVVL